MAAQEAYAETGAFPELLSIYHLLGDPALNAEVKRCYNQLTPSQHFLRASRSSFGRPSTAGLPDHVPVLVNDFAPSDRGHRPAGDGPSLGCVVGARRIVFRTRGALEVGIEDHEIGNGTFADDTALRVEAERLGCCGGGDLDEPLL